MSSSSKAPGPENAVHAPVLDLLPKHLEIVRAILRAHVPNVVVRAFGSRVQSQAKPHSDLDLVLVGSERLSARPLTLLMQDFEDSDLPFKVDIVDWTATPPDWRSRVLEHSVVVQSAGD